MTQAAHALLSDMVTMYDKDGQTVFHYHFYYQYPKHALEELEQLNLISGSGSVSGKVTLTEEGINYIKNP